MSTSNLTIIEVANNETGLREYAYDLFSKGEDQSFELRSRVLRAINAGNPLYSCGHCGQPVKVAAPKLTKTHHSFHFKHYYKSGDCPIKTDSSYSREEIQCMKYNGAKESTAHMELKLYLTNQLRLDNRFSDIAVEKVVKGSGWSRSWKKPDISAKFNGKPVVFEIQLSTTFVDVIVSREEFYQNEGISIFWVFSKLAPETARATEKDVYFNNKSNALSIDESSRELTKEHGQLIFNGHYRKPTFHQETGIIHESWEIIPVGFDDIKFDPITHKPFFISFEEQLNKALQTQRTEMFREPLKRLEELVLDTDDNLTHEDNSRCAAQLCKLGLYDENHLYVGICNLLKALFSVRDGKIHFANQNEKWVWLANYVWEHHKNHWVVFLYIVDVYGRKETILPESNMKLKAKRDAFKLGFRRIETVDKTV